jgi:hypothetical protein
VILQATERNKLQADCKMSTIWTKENSFMIYLFESGRRQFEEFYSGYSEERRSLVSEFDQHVLVGFCSSFEQADGLIDALIANDKKYSIVQRGQYRQRHLPIGMDQLDHHEYKHINNVEKTSRSHPPNHVALNNKGDCKRCA